MLLLALPLLCALQAPPTAPPDAPGVAGVAPGGEVTVPVAPAASDPSLAPAEPDPLVGAAPTPEETALPAVEPDAVEDTWVRDRLIMAGVGAGTCVACGIGTGVAMGLTPSIGNGIGQALQLGQPCGGLVPFLVGAGLLPLAGGVVGLMEAWVDEMVSAQSGAWGPAALTGAGTTVAGIALLSAISYGIIVAFQWGALVLVPVTLILLVPLAAAAIVGLPIVVWGLDATNKTPGVTAGFPPFWRSDEGAKKEVPAPAVVPKTDKKPRETPPPPDMTY